MSTATRATGLAPARLAGVLTSTAALVVVVALGALARLLQYLAGSSLSGDESFLALNLASRSYGELFDQLDYNQVAPQLLLVVEKLGIDAFGRSEWAVRLAPFLAGLAALALFPALARRLLPRGRGAACGRACRLLRPARRLDRDEQAVRRGRPRDRGRPPRRRALRRSRRRACGRRGPRRPRRPRRLALVPVGVRPRRSRPWPPRPAASGARSRARRRARGDRGGLDSSLRPLVRLGPERRRDAAGLARRRIRRHPRRRRGERRRHRARGRRPLRHRRSGDRGRRPRPTRSSSSSLRSPSRWSAWSPSCADRPSTRRSSSFRSRPRWSPRQLGAYPLLPRAALWSLPILALARRPRHGRGVRLRGSGAPRRRRARRGGARLHDRSHGWPRDRPEAHAGDGAAPRAARARDDRVRSRVRLLQVAVRGPLVPRMRLRRRGGAARARRRAASPPAVARLTRPVGSRARVGSAALRRRPARRVVLGQSRARDAAQARARTLEPGS